MLLFSFSEMRDDLLEIEEGSTGVAWPSSARVVDIKHHCDPPKQFGVRNLAHIGGTLEFG